MRFLILGPLEVRDEQGPIPLVGTKPRAVLAVLLLNAGEAVSAERLAMALWGDDADARAVKNVQVNVSRLRKALGNGVAIETSAAGYRLRLGPEDLDAQQFAGLVDQGRRQLAAGSAVDAAATLREALGLWRGPPLADVAAEPFAAAAIARLQESRLSALEARVEADLACGREAEIVGELQELVTAHPTRERLAGQLLLALYRCSRQADALEAYRETRRHFVEELGVEPDHELRALHDAILRQERSLLGARAAALPPELERTAAEHLEGRDVELAWLRERWQRVNTGAGALVTLIGEHGIGKSRLAAAFAAEAHANGATVLFADGSGPPATVLGVLARARRTPGPTLLIVDDADGVPDTVRAELAALEETVSGVPMLALLLSDGRDGNGDSLALPPLDIGAVHAIVTRYAPDRATEEPPAEWLLGASGGVPRRVHELARQWSRREAGRRVGAAAELTAARRTDLQALEEELATDVAMLEAGRDAATIGDGAQMCPFKGLASFQVADAPYFFGRERLLAEIVARVVGAPLLGIIGPSGSGKSSVLRAGLLPVLAAGVLPGSERWQQILIRPGEHPLQELRTACATVSDGPLVIAVDQFEETFTRCQDERERAAFLDELARTGRGAGVVAIALRADYYGHCAAHPEFARLLAASQVLVGAMRADELRRAIEGPSERAGLIVEPELVDALVADVDGEPGALPLLSTALLEQWQHRDGRRLRHAAYERAGGVRGAVARLGESAYARLDEPQQRIARGVLLALATFDEAGGVSRRRVDAEDLAGGDTAAVVELLADSRLLTVDAGTVELAHEALLREWPRLRTWIEEDRDALRARERLREAAAEWVRFERDDSALLSGARLAAARRWIEPDAPALEPASREFLEASLERQRRERTVQRRRRRAGVGVLVALLAVSVVVTFVAIDRRRQAERERDLALSRSLAAQSTQALDNDPELALRLALWADEITPTAQAGLALRQATLGFRQLGFLRADRQNANAAAYSPDGTRIVTGGDDGLVRLWDARTHKRLKQIAPERGGVRSARYSRDGSQIVLGFDKGTVVVTDAALGGEREVLNVRDGTVNHVAFSPDGTRIAAAMADGTVRMTGENASTLGTADDEVYGVDVDARGRVAAAYYDGSVKLFDAGGSLVTTLLEPSSKPERAVVFSPDGKRVLAVGEDGQVRLWDAETFEARVPINLGTRVLTSAAFSRDGSRFATGGWDGAVRVFQTDGGTQLLVLRGQLSRVYDVGFGRGLNRVVSAGDDGTARIFNAGGPVTFTDPELTHSIAFSPDSKALATATDDGAVLVWDAASGKLRRTATGPRGKTMIEYSPVGDELAIAREENAAVARWPKSAPEPLPVTELGKGPHKSVARFDPTGKRLVYVRQDMENGISVQDLDSGEVTPLGGSPALVYEGRFSPDGKEIAASTESGDVLVWKLDRPSAPYQRLRGHSGNINTIDYSRDGRIASSSGDRTVRVWDPHSGRNVALHGHTDEVYDAIFTADGTRVVSAGADGTVRLWDSRTGAALGILRAGAEPIYDLSLSPDDHIATVDGNEVVRIDACTVCGSVAEVRERALALDPRQLSDDERRRFLAAAG